MQDAKLPDVLARSEQDVTNRSEYNQKQNRLHTFEHIKRWYFAKRYYDKQKNCCQSVTIYVVEYEQRNHVKECPYDFDSGIESVDKGIRLIILSDGYFFHSN